MHPSAPSPAGLTGRSFMRTSTSPWPGWGMGCCVMLTACRALGRRHSALDSPRCVTTQLRAVVKAAGRKAPCQAPAERLLAVFWRRRQPQAGGEPPQACSSLAHARTCSGCSRLNLVTCTTVCWPLDAMLSTAAAGVWTLRKLGPTGQLGSWSPGSRWRQCSKDQTHSPWLLCRWEGCRHISAACNISSQAQKLQKQIQHLLCAPHALRE